MLRLRSASRAVTAAPENDLSARIRAATEVCQRAAAGDLEARVHDVDDESEFSERCHAVNRVLDMADAFIREAAAAMDHCSRDRYYRPILLRSLQGAYRQSALVINAAGCKMKAEHEARVATAALAAETAAHVGTVSAATEELTSSSNEIAQPYTGNYLRFPGGGQEVPGTSDTWRLLAIMSNRAFVRTIRRTFRIFVSSTFRDLKGSATRCGSTFPRLRELRPNRARALYLDSISTPKGGIPFALVGTRCGAA